MPNKFIKEVLNTLDIKENTKEVYFKVGHLNSLLITLSKNNNTVQIFIYGYTDRFNNIFKESIISIVKESVKLEFNYSVNLAVFSCQNIGYSIRGIKSPIYNVELNIAVNSYTRIDSIKDLNSRCKSILEDYAVIQQSANTSRFSISGELRNMFKCFINTEDISFIKTRLGYSTTGKEDGIMKLIIDDLNILDEIILLENTEHNKSTAFRKWRFIVESGNILRRNNIPISHKDYAEVIKFKVHGMTTFTSLVSDFLSVCVLNIIRSKLACKISTIHIDRISDYYILVCNLSRDIEDTYEFTLVPYIKKDGEEMIVDIKDLQDLKHDLHSIVKYLDKDDIFVAKTLYKGNILSLFKYRNIPCYAEADNNRVELTDELVNVCKVMDIL